MNRIYTLAAPLLAVTLVHAAEIVNGKTAAAKFKTSDWNKQWDVEKVNASNTIGFAAYDVAKPYSSYAKPDIRWALTLDLVADVPVPGTVDEYITATQLRVTPDDSEVGDMYELVTPMNEWQTCEQWMFAIDDRTVPETTLGLAGSDEDGAWDPINSECHDVLSDPCLGALRKIAESGDCKHDGVPDECSGEMAQEYLKTGMTTLRNDTMQNWELITEPNSNGTHAKGDIEAYKDALQKVHVLLFGVGQPGEQKSNMTGQDWEMKPGSKLNSSIMCIRAYSVTRYSLDFEDLYIYDGDDAGQSASTSHDARLGMISLAAGIAVMGVLWP